MRRFLTATLAALAVASTAAAADAHIQLMFPAQRHSEQKAGPCGVADDARGPKVTVLEPGAKITVTWDEEIEHPGHFRILFDEDGFDFPDPTGYDDFCDTAVVTDGIHCLADNIPDESNMPDYSVDVTLPDIECEKCTLQVIQVMSDKPPWGPDGGNDIYYQCADVSLLMGGAGGGGSAGGGGEASSSSSAGSGGGASSSSAAGTGGGGGDDGGGDEEGGCSYRTVGGEGGGALAVSLAALGLAGLSVRRRRRAG